MYNFWDNLIGCRGKYIVFLTFRAVVPNLFSSRDWFHGGQLFQGLRKWAGMVSGWLKCIPFTVHFISNLMSLMIWQEVLAHGLEVGDPCSSVLDFFSPCKWKSNLQVNWANAQQGPSILGLSRLGLILCSMSGLLWNSVVLFSISDNKHFIMYNLSCIVILPSV